MRRQREDKKRKSFYKLRPDEFLNFIFKILNLIYFGELLIETYQAGRIFQRENNEKEFIHLDDVSKYRTN